jgi:large subunit ribosomal protein L35
MPKMKSHSGAKKRFKITATGKVKHKQSNMSHILSSESRNYKRGLRGGDILRTKGDEKQIKRILPYGT